VYVREREIHFALRVPEHPQAEQLVRHPGKGVFRVGGRESDQHEQPTPIDR